MANRKAPKKKPETLATVERRKLQQKRAELTLRALGRSAEALQGVRRELDDAAMVEEIATRRVRALAELRNALERERQMLEESLDELEEGEDGAFPF